MSPAIMQAELQAERQMSRQARAVRTAGAAGIAGTAGTRRTAVGWLPAPRRPHHTRPVTPRGPQRPRGRAQALVLPVRPGRPVVRALPARYRRRRAMAVVVGLAVLAGVFGLAGGWVGGSGSVPEETTVVQVGAGETVWHVAQRTAPNGDPQAVVTRIRELNGMTSSAVRPGQPLRVPAGWAGD